jgi:hypothetical protein
MPTPSPAADGEYAALLHHHIQEVMGPGFQHVHAAPHGQRACRAITQVA